MTPPSRPKCDFHDSGPCLNEAVYVGMLHVTRQPKHACAGCAAGIDELGYWKDGSVRRLP